MTSEDPLALQLTVAMETSTIGGRPSISQEPSDPSAAILTFLDQSYKMDIADAFRILNCPKYFHFYNDADVYPAFKTNGRLLTLVEYLFDLNPAKNIYIFKNEDIRDLRKANVDIQAALHSFIQDAKVKPIEELLAPYPITGIYSRGHIVTLGKGAHKLKNPIWNFRRSEDGAELLLMYCMENTLCILCKDAYQKILNYEKETNNSMKITFTVHKASGHIVGSNNVSMYQILTGCVGKGHYVDGNPLNNVFDNLSSTPSHNMLGDVAPPVSEETMKLLLVNYTILGVYSKGHIVAMGREAKKYKNPIWRVMSADGTAEQLAMYCSQNTVCLLCKTSYEKIVEYEQKQNNGNKITFGATSRGILGSNRLYMHQIIVGCFMNALTCVQHVDGNKCNNTMVNLKIITKIQEDAEICSTVTNIRDGFEEILTPYNILTLHSKGHKNSHGRDANIFKNPIWRAKCSDDSESTQLLMYCAQNTLCILCDASHKRIQDFERESNDGKPITFFKHSNGYILGQNNLYIHQIIMGCFGHGRGTMNISVDHLDGNPLNNTLQNLRLATREEQEEHKIGTKEGTKRKRQCTAKDLPEGIDQSMLRKYVVYYNEVYHKEKQLKREFFKVESPKLDKPWISSKSGKVSALEKLTAANKVVDDLANDIFPTLQESVLPQYYSLLTFRDKPHLVYEQRMQETGERRNLKMVLPPDGTYDLAEQYQKLLAKVESKYALAATV